MRKHTGWKQRVLAWVLAAVMVAAMMPASAMKSFADEPDTAIGEFEIADEVSEETEESSIQLSEDAANQTAEDEAAAPEEEPAFAEEADPEDGIYEEDAVSEEPEEDDAISLVPDVEIVPEDPEETREPESLLEDAGEALGFNYSGIQNKKLGDRYAVYYECDDSEFSESPLNIWSLAPVSVPTGEDPAFHSLLSNNSHVNPSARPIEDGDGCEYYIKRDDVNSKGKVIKFQLEKKEKYAKFSAQVEITAKFADLDDGSYEAGGIHEVTVSREDGDKDDVYTLTFPAGAENGGDLYISIKMTALSIPMLTELARYNKGIGASLTYDKLVDGESKGKVTLSKEYDPEEGKVTPDPDVPIELRPEDAGDDYQCELIPCGAQVVIAKADITSDKYHAPVVFDVNDGDETTDALKAFRKKIQEDFWNFKEDFLIFTATPDLVGSRGMIVLQPTYTEMPRFIIKGREYETEKVLDRGYQSSWFGFYTNADPNEEPFPAGYEQNEKEEDYYLLPNDQGEIVITVGDSFLKEDGSIINDFGYSLDRLTYELTTVTSWDEYPVPTEVIETGVLKKEKSSLGQTIFRLPENVVQRAINDGIYEIRIVPVTSHMNTLTVKVPTGINPTVRIGSQAVNPDSRMATETYETDKFYLKDNVSAVVKLTSNSWNKITKVELTDSTTNGAKNAVKLSKNGEYTVKPGTADAELNVTGNRTVKLVVKSDGESISAKKGKYNVDYRKGFEAYLVEGGEDNVVKNGVTATINGEPGEPDNGKLISNPNAPDVAGQTLDVKLTYNEKSYAAKIAVSKKITAIKIDKEQSGKLYLNYGESYSLKITTTPKNLDLSGVEIYEVNDDGTKKGENPTPLNCMDVFKNKLEVYGDTVFNDYLPGNSVKIGLFSGNERIGGIYTVTFMGSLGTNIKPTVKINAKDTTLHEIGLTLGVPKGFNTSKAGLYYVVTATASDGDQEEWEDYDPGDGRFDPETMHKTNLNQWSHDDGKLIEVYKPTVTTYVYAYEKNAVIKVANESTAEDPIWEDTGWRVNYDISVRLVQCPNTEADSPVYRTEGGSVDTQASTKDQKYETKLTLKNTAPKKIFVGENDMKVAEAKFTAASTVRKLDHVVLTDAKGTERSGDYVHDDHRAENQLNSWIRLDEGTGEIFLTTERENGETEYDEELGHDVPCFNRLEPGKYTITAYALSGPGKPASASVKVTVAAPIAKITVKPATTRVYKQYNKAASVKASVSYESVWEWKVDTKKVFWDVAENVDKNEDGRVVHYDEISSDKPLYGKLKVDQKKATVTVDKSLLVPAGGLSFYLVATAADFDGNMVMDAAKITIYPEAKKPTTIRLMHGHYDWGENKWLEDSDSWIEEGNVVFTDNASYVYPYVYDQYGELMDESEYTLSLSGYTSWWERESQKTVLKVNKVGKTSVKATATDGSKASVTLSFKTKYADKDFTTSWVVQDGSREYADWDRSVIIGPEALNPQATVATNTCPANLPIYVSVMGVVIDEESGNWYDRSLIDHKISVTGGTKPVAMYGEGCYDTAVTYKIYPTAYETVISITNKTKKAGDYNKAHKITIKNTMVADANDTKAYEFKAVDDTIVNMQNLESYTQTTTGETPEGFLPDEAYNALYNVYPTESMVYFKIPKLTSASEANVALISMNRPEDDPDLWNFARYLGSGNDQAVTTGGVITRLSEEDGIKGVSLDFYELEPPYSYHPDNIENVTVTGQRFKMNRIKTGKYSFYVTVGKAVWDDVKNEWKDFTPSARPTKLTVKVVEAPKPKATIASKVTVPEDTYSKGYFTIAYPSLSKGQRFNEFMDLRGSLNGGEANQFTNMFYLEQAKGSVWVNDGKLKIQLNRENDPSFRVLINKEEHWLSWKELALLKKGKWEGVSDKNGKTFKAAVQKKAYKAFVKNNCTGYLEVRPVQTDGQQLPAQYLKITVNIDKFLDKFDHWMIAT